MIVDWIVYGLIIWGLATILNKTAFKNAPASRGVAWGLTILLFSSMLSPCLLPNSSDTK